MGGHVFVVPGQLQSLRCDDVLISTDAGGDVGESWWPVFGWDDDEAQRRRDRYGPFPDGERVRLAEEGDRDDGVPRRWLADVGGYAGRPVGWLLDGVREALTAAAEHAAEPLGPKRRIALPIMGVSGGGYDQQRGAVIHGLLERAQQTAEKHDVDVVLVARKLSDYSACQALRQSDHDLPLSGGREAKAGGSPTWRRPARWRSSWAPASASPQGCPRGAISSPISPGGSTSTPRASTSSTRSTPPSTCDGRWPGGPGVGTPSPRGHSAASSAR